MNEHLVELITPENILSYSQACIDVFDELQLLKAEDYRRLVIPSRGAYPFFLGAMASPGLSRLKGMKKFEFRHNFRELLFPYTADWGQGISTNSKVVRSFWTRILADYIRRDASPYTRFYQNVIDYAGRRLTANTTGLRFEDFVVSDRAQDEKFVFIDTAVSGQAICEVIESFHECDLKNYYIIMIADENGSRIKREYRDIIAREKNRGRLRQINVSRIYSEDASPLLNTGISSIVFPSLIERAFHDIPLFRDERMAGAGLWFVDVASHLRDTRLNGVRGALISLNQTGMRKCAGENLLFFEESVTRHAELMVQLLDQSGFNLNDSGSTKDLIYKRIASRASKMEDEVDVSGSHVIRIELPDALISQIINETRL